MSLSIPVRSSHQAVLQRGCRPVLVGMAALQHREVDLSAAGEPITRMIKACRQAGRDAGDEAWLRHVERIYVPQGLWRYPDPARLIADALGISVHTVLAEIGILQQSLLGDACARIATGDIQCALVVGGEAKYRQQQAQRQGVLLQEAMQTATPDTTWRPEADLVLEAEMQAGLLMPVGFYALIESALRAARGEAVATHRQRIAALYERMSAVAAANPDAWSQRRVSAAEIAGTVGKNRMLAFPYTKWHSSEWNVDQACALLLCSEALADAWGVPLTQRVYPLASSESNHMSSVAQRAQLADSPGARLALEAALQQAGLTGKQLDLLELYSCFPASVQMFANVVGVDPMQRDITVTGGMPFAGGPLNNYVLQATCRMAQLLRARQDAGCVGAVSSVSGMLTKQAWGLWSNQPGECDYAWLDVSDAVARHTLVCEVLSAYEGPARIVAYTVLFEAGLPQRAVVVADVSPAVRALAWSDAPDVMASMQETEWCGKTVHINRHGQFT